MQVYLVGGAVRDTLLGRTVTERDYVVVGATPEQMLAKGYTQVGKDFPVFLHPKTSEEYALARTERKKGLGYTGFECDVSTSVTLEEDLKRRDLTVNAIAQAKDGSLIDPYHGQQDLQRKILRHVSEAFSEDPLRVFRVARFATRYAYLGFTIAQETLSLMQTMATSGELITLSAERVWQETRRSLLENTPDVFFSTLKACNGLHDWFTELSTVENAYNMAIQALQNTSPSEGEDLLSLRFTALCSGLNTQQVRHLSTRLKVQNAVSEIAEMASAHKGLLLDNDKLDADALLTLFNKTDAWRRPERFTLFLKALQPLVLMEASCQTDWAKHTALVLQALHAANSVDVQHIIAQGYKGPAIRDALDKAKLIQIDSAIS